MRRRLELRDERGWALMTTVIVMAILMAIALPLMTLVDTQQRGSADERRSEGSFTVADGALNSTVFVLSSAWPGSSSAALPSSCTQASTGTGCPNAAALSQTYQGPDFSSLAWTVKVRDDAGPEYYDPAVIDVQPTWDANGNGKLWVRAQGRAAGRSRVIVALVRMNEQVETFPRRVISAGWFQTTNNGKKVIVDTRGSAAEPAALGVRCNSNATSCLGYNSSKGQVSPEIVETSISGDTAVSPAVLAGFRERAQSLGTYYATGCPSSPAGTLVFVENASCSYSGGGKANSAAAPGMIVMARGKLTFGGNFVYYGLVYAANLSRSTAAQVVTGGTAEIVGAVSVDYGGGLLAGSSKKNITFSEQALPEIRSHRLVGIVQGSWRELPAS